MKLSEISSKDVINDEDGVKLGKIVDAEIDVATGKIVNVTIYRGFKFVRFSPHFLCKYSRYSDWRVYVLRRL